MPHASAYNEYISWAGISSAWQIYQIYAQIQSIFIPAGNGVIPLCIPCIPVSFLRMCRIFLIILSLNNGFVYITFAFFGMYKESFSLYSLGMRMEAYTLYITGKNEYNFFCKTKIIWKSYFSIDLSYQSKQKTEKDLSTVTKCCTSEVQCMLKMQIILSPYFLGIFKIRFPWYVI